jgi:hypothetical protein
MKTYIQGIVNRFKSYSERLDNFSLLIDQPWITRAENTEDRCVYIFRKENKELYILTNGVMKKEDEGSTWDYIAPMNSLLIRRNGETRLYNQGFFDESVMILKLDGTDQFQLFANENKIETTIEKLLEKVESKYARIEKTDYPQNEPKILHQAYYSPGYKEIFKKNSSKILIGKYKVFEIRFLDGLKGAINQDKDGNYFILKGWVLPTFIVYHDKESCINGLHFYLKYGDVLQKNIKETFY